MSEIEIARIKAEAAAEALEDAADDFDEATRLPGSAPGADRVLAVSAICLRARAALIRSDQYRTPSVAKS